jgi:prophage regulatory protein
MNSVTAPDATEIRFLPSRETERLTGTSRWTLWRWANEGRFPRPIKLSNGKNVYVESEVRQWMAERLAERA